MHINSNIPDQLITIQKYGVQYIPGARVWSEGGIVWYGVKEGRGSVGQGME